MKNTNTGDHIIEDPASKAAKSGAVLIAFASKWRLPLENNQVPVVIRKRVPKDKNIKWLYMYVNSPVSSITCRAQIAQLCDISKDEAIALSDAISMTPEAIAAYIGNNSHVGYFKLELIETAETPVHREKLMQMFGIHPPQGYLPLAPDVQAGIDSLATFSFVNR